MNTEHTLFWNLRHSWEEKKTRNFWPVINSMQKLILYLHKNDDVLKKLQLLR